MKKILFLILLFIFIPNLTSAACSAFELSFGYSNIGDRCCIKKEGNPGDSDWGCPTGQELVMLGDWHCCHGDSGGGIGIGGMNVDVYFKKVGPRIVDTGEEVSGILVVTVTCSGTTVKPEVTIDFGDGYSELFGPSVCSPRVSGDEKKEVYNYDFSHIYLDTDDYLIIATGMEADEGETIMVLNPIEGVSVPPIESGVKAANTSEVIQSAVNVAFYALSGLAIVFLVLGGMIWTTAAGVPAQVTKGKMIIMATLGGYAVILTAKGIMGLLFKILTD